MSAAAAPHRLTRAASNFTAVRRSWSIVFAALLLLGNAWAWLQFRAADLPEVEPRLDPRIAEIRDRLFSGQHTGERFEIVITDRMAAEAVAWYLQAHPSVPFGHPQVRFHASDVQGSGLVTLFGLPTPVSGRARIQLRDSLPVVSVLQITIGGVSASPALLGAIQAQVDQQQALAHRLPVLLERLEFSEGAVLVEGVYR